jgi:hypothetical protein
MKRNANGIVSVQLLVAGVIVAFISLFSFLVTPELDYDADMYLSPEQGIVRTNEQFVAHLIVDARIPVNVFKGEIRFDPLKLAVVAIEYNTSLADLWAEKPWYENGAGTINFIGGTTQKGGFLGTGTLITITFESHNPGDASITVVDARILAHDGLGSDVSLGKSLDALFHVESPSVEFETIARPDPVPAQVAVVPSLTRTDLNGDGVQTIADVSVFMVGMVHGGEQYDFNNDGVVGAADLSIIVSIPRE